MPQLHLLGRCSHLSAVALAKVDGGGGYTAKTTKRDEVEEAEQREPRRGAPSSREYTEYTEGVLSSSLLLRPLLLCVKTLVLHG